jgi:hypothetical protein
MLFDEYPKQGNAFFLGYGRVMQYPFKFKKYVMEPNVFSGYPKRGIVRCIE